MRPHFSGTGPNSEVFGFDSSRLYYKRFPPLLSVTTGLNFFNDDVINFFSPHATGKAAIFQFAIGSIFQFAIGKPMKRKPLACLFLWAALYAFAGDETGQPAPRVLRSARYRTAKFVDGMTAVDPVEIITAGNCECACNRLCSAR
jgi:hypothetical protein